MIMGLCGSFAVVPAFSFSMVGHGSPTGRAVLQSARSGSPEHLAGGAAPVSAEAVSADPTSLTAVLLSDVATAEWSGPTPAAPAAPAAAAAPTAPVPAPAAPTASPPASLGASAAALAALAALAAPPAAPVPPPAPVARSAPLAALVPSRSSRAGQATWLDTIPAGTCASNDAPMGTVLTVTNNVGASVTCRVVSTGPFVAGRIVDLAKSTFAGLCPVSAGLVAVSVRW